MSNEITAPDQKPEAGTARQLPTRVRRRGRRLTMQDAREIAALCALRASEAEACAALGIPISSWHHFKARSRNSEAYQEMMDALRGAKIRAHMGNIEKFAEKDFRASVAYLEKMMPERYSSKASAQEPPPRDFSVRVSIGLKAGLALYSELSDKNAKPAQAIALTAEPKQLTDAGHE